MVGPANGKKPDSCSPEIFYDCEKSEYPWADGCLWDDTCEHPCRSDPPFLGLPPEEFRPVPGTKRENVRATIYMDRFEGQPTAHYGAVMYDSMGNGIAVHKALTDLYRPGDYVRITEEYPDGTVRESVKVVVDKKGDDVMCFDGKKKRRGCTPAEMDASFEVKKAKYSNEKVVCADVGDKKVTVRKCTEKEKRDAGIDVTHLTYWELGENEADYGAYASPPRVTVQRVEPKKGNIENFIRIMFNDKPDFFKYKERPRKCENPTWPEATKDVMEEKWALGEFMKGVPEELRSTIRPEVVVVQRHNAKTGKDEQYWELRLTGFPKNYVLVQYYLDALDVFYKDYKINGKKVPVSLDVRYDKNLNVNKGYRGAHKEVEPAWYKSATEAVAKREERYDGDMPTIALGWYGSESEAAAFIPNAETAFMESGRWTYDSEALEVYRVSVPETGLVKWAVVASPKLFVTDGDIDGFLTHAVDFGFADVSIIRESDIKGEDIESGTLSL